eukprot:XP_011675213.1 PREDICTED: transmembrane protein 179-like [Strongylocentrotus purpuratus]
MGLGNILLLSQIIGYIFGAIFSLFTFPPIAVSQQHFDDHCILFSTGYLNKTIGGRYVVNQWSLGSQCGFAIFVGIQLMGISLWQSIRLSIHAINGTDSSFLDDLYYFIGDLSDEHHAAGFCHHCHRRIQSVVVQLFRKLVKAVNLQDMPMSSSLMGNISPEGFNIDWGIAQFGLWTSWILYTILLIFSLIKICKLHKQENILHSLTRERQRLLGHYEQPDV